MDALAEITVHRITRGDALWDALIAFFEASDWRSAPIVAEHLRTDVYLPWERSFVAVLGGEVVGHVALHHADAVPDVSYTPYIQSVLVSPEARGHRVSERLIAATEAWAAQSGFSRVYIVSNHSGLYEKYGYNPVDYKPSYTGAMETIFAKDLWPDAAA